jgi:hypothetical protein
MSDDDRRHCYECRRLQSGHCSETKLRVMDDLPRRCVSYRPTRSDPDQRPGNVRWAWIVIERERENEERQNPTKPGRRAA